MVKQSPIFVHFCYNDFNLYEYPKKLIERCINPAIILLEHTMLCSGVDNKTNKLQKLGYFL